jgi:type I restriction enzyme S subunit
VVGRKGSLGTVFFLDRPFWPHDTTLWIKDFKGNNPYFCYLLLKSLHLADLDAGSSNPTLNRNHAHKLKVSRPSVRTQRRIGATVAAFDELIEINERRIELLEDLARSLYREWFVHFRFPGHEDVEFVDSELGPIPERWEARHLSDVVTTQYGLTTSASKETVGPKLLRGMDINKRSFVNWEEVPFCSAEEDDVEKFGVDVGDVLVVRMADPGKVGIVERPVEAVFASYLVRFRSVNPSVSPYLLFHFLDSPRYQTWIRGSSTGSTRKSASAAVLTEPVMVIPPSDIATRFESKVGPLRSALTSLVEQSAAFRRTRDLLLPRLVTGKLDISDIDLGVLTPAETE